MAAGKFRIPPAVALAMFLMVNFDVTAEEAESLAAMQPEPKLDDNGEE
ncbi:MAG TPA: hypothetical protein VF601_11260 [Beijerinckiaceae bacterium]|jgi:hypothetical protein